MYSAYIFFNKKLIYIIFKKLLEWEWVFVDEKIKVFLMGKWDKIQSLGSQ
jgi:hypothetical protein